jgi:hypothetical protein
LGDILTGRPRPAYDVIGIAANSALRSVRGIVLRHQSLGGVMSI